MRKFLILLGRELRAFFCSPIAYVVISLFLLVTGFNFSLAVYFLNQGIEGINLVEVFFNQGLFWFLYIPIFPLLTMRLFAEEFKMGTIETLMTAPVRDWQVVLAKYFGAFCFFVMLWAPTPFYFLIFTWVTGSNAADAPGSYIGSYTMTVLMGGFCLAVGCLASVLTRNQIVAAVLSFCATMLIFVFSILVYVIPNVPPEIREAISYISVSEHMIEYSRGMIDSRPLVLYPSVTFLVLYLTHQVFQSRKWRT